MEAIGVARIHLANTTILTGTVSNRGADSAVLLADSMEARMFLAADLVALAEDSAAAAANCVLTMADALQPQAAE